MSEYSNAPRAYLSRAKDALEDGTSHALFYAAFELRCCIESRLFEYAEAHQHYTGKKIKAWNIKDIFLTLSNKSYVQKISRMQFDFGEELIDSFHTPVTRDLARFAERKLGVLLHSQQVFRAPQDTWWEETRTDLVAGYRMAWIACRGDSLVPPLINKKTNLPHPFMIEVTQENENLGRLFRSGLRDKFSFKVEYLESCPPEWECDL